MYYVKAVVVRSMENSHGSTSTITYLPKQSYHIIVSNVFGKKFKCFTPLLSSTESFVLKVISLEWFDTLFSVSSL